jgi:beta-glucosidase-like glycosyl hydrolase
VADKSLSRAGWPIAWETEQTGGNMLFSNVFNITVSPMMADIYANKLALHTTSAIPFKYKFH